MIALFSALIAIDEAFAQVPSRSGHHYSGLLGSVRAREPKGDNELIKLSTPIKQYINFTSEPSSRERGHFARGTSCPALTVSKGAMDDSEIKLVLESHAQNGLVTICGTDSSPEFQELIANYAW